MDAAGVEVVTNTVPGAGLRQLFLTDPNGVRVESQRVMVSKRLFSIAESG